MTAAPSDPGSSVAPPPELVHAGALVIRECGLLIRGDAGSGKSMLAGALILEADRRGWFARRVADDRVALLAHAGRLVARPHPRTAGRFELRGFGIIEAPHEPACVLHHVIDLVAPQRIARMPEPADRVAIVAAVRLPRLVLPAGAPVYDNVYRVLESIPAFRPR